MNTKLSTDELFHFTRFDNLISIIKEGFHPRYNLEHTHLSDLYERPAALETIPMVCFCDIPLNMAQDHTSKYGRCAIGLDKRWGERYGLSPVVYVHKNSRIGDAISTLGNSFSGYSSSMIKEGSDIGIFMMISAVNIGVSQLSYYVKQYERTEDERYWINDKVYEFKKGRFYDEREWRFVPPGRSSEDFWLVNADILHNETALAKAHEKLKRHSLKFQIDDIRYIVCETEDEKSTLMETLAEQFKVDKDIVLKKVIFHILEKY